MQAKMNLLSAIRCHFRTWQNPVKTIAKKMFLRSGEINTAGPSECRRRFGKPTTFRRSARWIFSIFAALMVICGQPQRCFGGDNGTDPASVPIEENNRVAKTDDDDLPSLEMLEFLGEWETEEGEWIDPMELDQMDLLPQEQNND
jgi:hypothetical protein